MPRRPQNVMTSASQPPDNAKTNWAQLGIDAARGGNYENAIDLFVTAIAHDKRNAGLRYNLAIALHRNGEIDDAAVALTEALRLKPGLTEATQRLSLILEQYDIDEPGRLETAGLLHALSTASVPTQPLGKIAFRLLKTAGPLGETLVRAGRDGWDATAIEMLTPRTAPLLRDPLFLKALMVHVNQDAEIELLLTALRRILLTLDPERYADKTILAFAMALAGQCLGNEHVFELADGEVETADALLEQIVPTAKPSPHDIRTLVCALMYHPIDAVVKHAPDRNAFANLRPKPLREFILPIVSRQVREDDIVANLDGGDLAEDDTSHKVAAQYEHRPYPRWTSLRRPREATLAKALQRFVPENRLGFMTQSFEVLIAGCGTGRHAIQSAIGYGANARVTAIDLSRRSLAYAVRSAEDLDVRNISFAQADLLNPNFTRKMFDIVECVGVLHHLADPLAGLRAVNDRLKPGGLMQIGLYSAVSREELSELRIEDAFPGTDCSDDAARAYRGLLRDREADATGGELTNSIDFWSLSGFRDLVLHVSEQQFRLPDIESALVDLGLEFRGFNLHPNTVEEFEAVFPNDPWPGTLANWWAYEQEHPRLFDGMYNFWVEKPDPSRPQ